MGNFLPFFMVIFSLPHLVSQMKVYNKRSRRCPKPLCVNNTNNIYRCSCRPDCYLYNECCSNKINKTTSHHKQPYPSIYYNCRKVDASYYYQFDRCPPNHDVTEYVNNCESPDSDDQLQSIPAFGKTSKKLYRNLYCALCHEEEFILWNLLYTCSFISNISFENITSYVEEGTCRLTPELPSEDLRKYLYSCIPYISDCPQDNINRKQRFKCISNPMALVTDRVNIFRNIHCATCRGLKKNKIKNYCKPFRARWVTKSRKISLTMLFNYHSSSLVIKDKLLKEVSVVQLPSCPTHAPYDFNTNQCRQVIYSPQLNCTITTLNESEYYITSDGRLYINNTQRLLNKSEFSQDSEGIISICVKNSTTVLPKYSTAEYYITYVGLIISIPALAITIIVYLCIPDLRTLPGKLLISLLSALLVAELLFLISSQVTPSSALCISLAVIMHYSFLATFFWMNIISGDTWYTFSGLKQIRNIGKATKKLVLYSLYAWICPLLIVTVSLIFEYIPGNHGLSPDYGNGICWITNGKSLLWLFAIPVIIILCLNFIAFILTARGLYLTGKLSSKYLSKHNKDEFIACVKLFFIMGLTWIFAFLYTFTRIEEFSLLFCILNSFVGLFICVSFLSTKTVRRSILRNLHKITKFSTKEPTVVSSTEQSMDISIKSSG